MSEEKLAHNSQLVEDFAKFLDCPCAFYAPMIDDDPLREAYQNVVEEAHKSGDFVPVFIIVSDELLRTLLANSDDHNISGDINKLNPERVAEFRQYCLKYDSAHGNEFLGDLLSITQEILDDPILLEKMINQEGGSIEVLESGVSWWNYSTDKTYPLLLAKIPVKHPYEIFAYLPMGGWNDCPCNEALISIARLWFEKFSAVPKILGADSLEFALPQPVHENEAKDLAIRQYAFCPSIIEGSENITIGSHAQSLTKSNVWFFWWN